MKDTIKVSKDFYPGLGYDYKFGVFYRLKYEDDKLVVAHVTFPADDGMLTYYCAVTKKNKKVRPLRAAYEIFNEKALGLDERVYAKDLDENNWKADNVGVLPLDVVKNLADALYNVKNGVLVENKPNKPYTYVVKWKEKGKIRHKTVHDITAVHRLKRIIMWKSYKLVSKYTVST